MNEYATTLRLCILSVVAVGILGLFVGCQQKESVGAGRPLAATSEGADSIAETVLVTKSSPSQKLAVERPWVSEPQVENSIVIALDADMSSGSSDSGESIRRGLELAIDEINSAGGLLGRTVELIVRDHRGNPDRGLGNLKHFVKVPGLLGVFGGKHTPVAMRELDFIHDNDLLYFGPWAAGTPVVKNGFDPNHVFRVSVRDEYAGGFLVDRAIQRGAKKIGLMLERTSWGRSNETAIIAALDTQQLTPVGVEWFNWGVKDLRPHVERLVDSGCDVLLLVSNAMEGTRAVEAVASISPERRPMMISHWGIIGGDFVEQASEYLDDVDLSFLQTFSFVDPPHPQRVAPLIEAYVKRYSDCSGPRDIFAPVGTAHAYELMKMVAVAVREAHSIETDQVIVALENLRGYQGIIRDYDHPFPSNHHDALDANDFILARFDSDGVILPSAE